jgi:hypothetical protein
MELELELELEMVASVIDVSRSVLKTLAQTTLVRKSKMNVI